MNADLVVIGAGPAGLSAAIQAASYGARVVVVDENPCEGGKLLGQLHEEPGQGWWIGKEVARQLGERARSLGVTLLREREVWGVFPGWQVKMNRQEELEAPYLLIATGAVERAVPIPGWTLPGVMTVGAAQVLANVHWIRPGDRILIVGVDALSLTVARELAMAGADVVGIVLPPPSPFQQLSADPRFSLGYLSRMAHLAPTSLLRMAGTLVKEESVRYLAARFFPKKGVRLWGVPLMLRQAAVEISGHETVRSVTLAELSHDGRIIEHTDHQVDVDCVCLSGGLYPLAELAAAAGCRFVYLPELGGHVPLHGPHLETTVPGLFVAGNITGIEGARVAMAQGELAGTVIAAKLQLLPPNNEGALVQQTMEKVKAVRRNSSIHFLPDVETGRRKMQEMWENSKKQQTAF
jgi:sarcosine oxidase subunit alpha